MLQLKCAFVLVCEDAYIRSHLLLTPELLLVGKYKVKAEETLFQLAKEVDTLSGQHVLLIKDDPFDLLLFLFDQDSVES